MEFCFFLRQLSMTAYLELKAQTKQFAHYCYKMAKKLGHNRLDQEIAKQLVRCPSSTAANYRAARIAQSKSAFVAKISIVLEEADEIQFWLEFIRDEGLVNGKEMELLIQEAGELAKIFTASRGTAQNRK